MPGAPLMPISYQRQLDQLYELMTVDPIAAVEQAQRLSESLELFRTGVVAARGIAMWRANQAGKGTGRDRVGYGKLAELTGTSKALAQQFVQLVAAVVEGRERDRRRGQAAEMVEQILTDHPELSVVDDDARAAVERALASPRPRRRT